VEDWRGRLVCIEGEKRVELGVGGKMSILLLLVMGFFVCNLRYALLEHA
jgi:hypothetical protein